MGEKPHLLTAVKNNLGAETRIAYAPSTTFYLRDKSAGQPLLQELRQMPGLNVIGCDPVNDKETRMYAETPQIESGNVVIPKEAPWLCTPVS